MIMIVYFDYSVIRRLVSLLSEQANLVAQREAALKQARNASDEASRQMAQAKVMHCCVGHPCDQTLLQKPSETATVSDKGEQTDKENKLKEGINWWNRILKICSHVPINIFLSDKQGLLLFVQLLMVLTPSPNFSLPKHCKIKFARLSHCTKTYTVLSSTVNGECSAGGKFRTWHTHP